MRWETYKLGDILARKRETAILQKDQEYKLVTIKLRHQGVVLREVKKGSEIKSNMYFVSEGDFVLSGIDARNGAFGIVPKELDRAVVTNDFWVLEPNKEVLTKDFFLFLTSTKFFDYICKQCSDGTTQRIRLQKDKFNEFEISLPSVDEQKQVVSTLIGYKDLNSNLFSELTHQLTLLKQLRQAFLREAMQGKLVPQDSRDEPAAQLLARIKAEKGELIRAKKIREGKLQEAEMLDELFFDIPDSWEWCKLDEICSNITDGTHQTPTYTTTGRIFLSAQNVKPFRFMPDDHKFVSEEAYQSYIKNRKPEKGDLLIGRVGAGIGETAVIDRDMDFCIYVSLGLIQPFKQFVNSNYLAYVFNSPYGYRYAKGNISSKGGSAGNFNLGRIRSFPIPLPPLAEQHRIVAKLDELMRYCDDLEASILASQGQNEGLLQQVLREALEVG